MFVNPAAAQEAASSPEAHTEVAASDGHGGGQFPPFDASTFPSQILWLAITFGLFYLFMKRVLVPRIGGILELRSDRIAQDLDEAGRLKDEADAAVAAYEQELADARAKARGIGQDARDKAKAEADAERAKVEAELEGKLDEAENRVASIKANAMKEVGTIAEETAAEIVRRLVGGSVDKSALSSAIKAARS